MPTSSKEAFEPLNELLRSVRAPYVPWVWLYLCVAFCLARDLLEWIAKVLFHALPERVREAAESLVEH